MIKTEYVSERAQKRVEGHNFDIRKQLLEFDNIIDNQRNIIYSKREMIITEDILNFIKETEEEFITNLLEGEEDEIKNFYNTLPFMQNKNMNDNEKAVIKTVINIKTKTKTKLKFWFFQIDLDILNFQILNKDYI